MGFDKLDHKKKDKKKAVVLFSGGLDSTTVLKIAMDEGYDVLPVTFFYGQRHAIEIEHAKKIAAFFNLKNHIIIALDFSQIKGSALVDYSISVPKNMTKKTKGVLKYAFINNLKNGNKINPLPADEYGHDDYDDIANPSNDLNAMSINNKHDKNKEFNDIPVTYVPARNTIFLSYALAVCEVNKTGDIFIGVNWVDYSGYPDCRPEYIKAFENTANLATKISVTGEIKFKIHTPLIKMSKKNIIISANKIGVPLELTHSCYDPAGDLACGACDSCILRKKGFLKAGIKDPAQYAK